MQVLRILNFLIIEERGDSMSYLSKDEFNSFKKKIVQDATPNMSDRKGHTPIMIVNHITEGNFNGAISWLKNPAAVASSHFVVSRKGEVVQLVPLDKMAWCNGTAVTAGSKVYYGLSNNPIVKEKSTNANLFTVSIEHEAFSTNKGALTEEQLNSTIILHKYIIDEVERLYKHRIIPSDMTIVGHNTINPVTKPNCPGGNFPLAKIREELISGFSKNPPIAPDNTNWKRELGLTALSSLNSLGIVDNIDFWRDKLEDKAENWLLFALIDRVIKEIKT
jgi:N-acetyl-anhydromuramyl-L-alanine amidase AmpD